MMNTFHFIGLVGGAGAPNFTDKKNLRQSRSLFVVQKFPLA